MARWVNVRAPPRETKVTPVPAMSRRRVDGGLVPSPTSSRSDHASLNGSQHEVREMRRPDRSRLYV